VKYCCLSRPHALAAGDKAAERAGKRDGRKLIDVAINALEMVNGL